MQLKDLGVPRQYPVPKDLRGCNGQAGLGKTLRGCRNGLNKVERLFSFQPVLFY